MERILRILNLLFCYTIASSYAPATSLAVKSIAVEKRIMARKVGFFRSLFKTKREGGVLEEGGATKT